MLAWVVGLALIAAGLIWFVIVFFGAGMDPRGGSYATTRPAWFGLILAAIGALVIGFR